MQRLFSMFPTGLPGVALLLLRVSVIGMLFGCAIQNTAPGALAPLRLLLLALVSLLLLCGAITPIASLLAAILQAINWPLWDGLKSLEFSLQVLVMIALFLLGPGAYSVDSKMFGRRVILPPQ